MQPDPRLILRYQAAACAAAVLTLLLGAAALGGWLLGIDALKSLVPGVVTMKANTAVGLLLCGAALLAVACPGGRGRGDRLARAPAGAAALLALADAVGTWLSVLVGLIGLSGVVGNISGTTSLYALGERSYS